MKPWESWVSHLSTLLVTASGLAYLWMKYGMVSDDPFSVVNHPWQPAMLNVHLLSAPFLVFVIGLITHSHIRKKLNSGDRRNRVSGLASAIMLPVMALSGYGLQVSTNPTVTRGVLVLHLASSSLFVLSYLTHQVISFRLVRRSGTRRNPEALARSRTA